jgi:hypothetical protein
MGAPLSTPPRGRVRARAPPRTKNLHDLHANASPLTTHVGFGAYLVTAGARRASDHAPSGPVCTCFSDATNQSGARGRDRLTGSYVIDFIHVFCRSPAPRRALAGSCPVAPGAGCRGNACGPGAMGADDVRGAPSDRPEAGGGPASPSTVDGGLRVGGAAASAAMRSLRVPRRATLPRAPAGDAQGPPVAVPAPCDRARRELRVPGVSAARRNLSTRWGRPLDSESRGPRKAVGESGCGRALRFLSVTTTAVQPAASANRTDPSAPELLLGRCSAVGFAFLPPPSRRTTRGGVS